jgi:hypothetical protein
VLGAVGGRDAGPRDAGPGRDSGRPPDTGAFDAGPGDVDSGGMDAGGGTDAGDEDAGDTPTLCEREHAGALFCDGFEDPGFDAWTRTDTEPGAMVRRETVETFDGRGALRVETGDGYSVAAVHATVFPMLSAGDLWVRSYYYFPSSSPLDGIEVAGLSSVDRAEELVIYVNSGTSDFHGHGYIGDIRHSLDTPPDRDRWICLEQHIVFDAVAGEIEIYADGDLLGERTAIDTTSRMGITTIEAGIVWQEQPGTTIYVDEVVGDTSRIGCE